MGTLGITRGSMRCCLRQTEYINRSGLSSVEQKQMPSRSKQKPASQKRKMQEFSIQRATSTSVLFGRPGKSSAPAEREILYAASRIGRFPLPFTERFCAINASKTSPQLIQRWTVLSADNSGLHSSIMSPLHFWQIIAHLHFSSTSEGAM